MSPPMVAPKMVESMENEPDPSIVVPSSTTAATIKAAGSIPPACGG